MSEFIGMGTVVTGAGSGIGRAVTLRLARDGANVLAVDITEEAVRETAAMAHGGRVIPYKADVTSAAEVQGYVEKAKSEFGNIRLFHNNAGVGGVHKSIIETSLEEWDRVMDINLRSFFLGLKYVLPAIKSSGGGSVVITGSVLSLKGAPDRSDYVVSKHAVLGLARSAAAEVATDGIRVNCICPGPLEGRLMSESERLVNPGDPDYERQRFEQGTPMGRYGKPEEIAEMVAFLLSDRSSYATGAVISVDGGIMAV